MADVIDRAAKELGFRILLCNVEHDLDREHSAIQMLISANADGIIIASNNSELQYELSQCEIPVVILDSLFRTKDVNAYI